MRKAGAAELSNEWAILEPDGKISIVPANPVNATHVSKVETSWPLGSSPKKHFTTEDAEYTENRRMENR